MTTEITDKYWECIDKKVFPPEGGKVKVQLIARRSDGEYFYRYKKVESSASDDAVGIAAIEVRTALDEYLGVAGDEAIVKRKTEG